MSLFCINSTKASSIIGKSQSDTSLSSVKITTTFHENEGWTQSNNHNTEKQRSYSMGWLAKLLDNGPDRLGTTPKTHSIVPAGYVAKKDLSLDTNNNEESVNDYDPVSKIEGPTTIAENIFYTRKLKLDKLAEYSHSKNEIKTNITYSNKTKKRKINDLDPNEDIKPKRRRECGKENRQEIDGDNRREFLDDNNNLLDDDELDAEVAMFMEKSGPPTIWDNNPLETTDREATQIYQQATPSPWLRCIEGCYHRFRSPLGITTEPRKGAIRILDPWPCLYRNTKFGELNIVGEIDLKKAPSHWKRIDE